MLLQQIRCFIAVAEAGSFTAAARVLHLSQPELGGHVRNSETGLAVALLERHSRGVVLSQARRAFLAASRKVMAALEEARTVVEPFNARVIRIALGITPTSGKTPVPDLLMEAAEQRPEMQFHLRAGIEITDVQYRGGSEVSRDVMAGTLDCGHVAIPNVISLMQGDWVRMLAIASARRSTLLPELPTLGEIGLPDAVLDETYGLFAPAGTPEAVIRRLASGLSQALNNTEARDELASLGAEPTPSNPGEFVADLVRERDLVEAIVRNAGIEME